MKTRNLKNKTLSILLAIVMLLGMLPTTALAASPSDYTCTQCGKPCTEWYPMYDSGKSAHAPLCSDCNSAVLDELDYCTLVEGSATCIYGELCSVCGFPDDVYSSPDPDAHSYGDWKFGSPTQHYRSCTICGTPESYEYEDHYGGTATCTEQAICEACGWSYGEALGHTPGAAATCTTDQICTRNGCGEVLVEKLGHDWGEWVQSGEQHTRACSRDAAHTETGYCYGGTATCTEKAKCTVCGTEYGNLADHTYGTEWKSDGTNHWHECSCGAKADSAAHSGGTATCKDKAVCSVCNVAYGELAAHNYKDGKCSVCKASNPNYQPPASDSPQTGDNSHMALWIVLLILGGAVIMLIVVDRKRKAVKR